MPGQTTLETLDAAARGLLLALVDLGASDALLDCLDRRRRVACSHGKSALDALDDRERIRIIAAWRQEARTALPAALSRLHPSWIDEALAGERAEMAAAVRSGLSAASPGAPEQTVALVRLALGHLLPLCEGEVGPLAERLCGLEAEKLVAEVARRGARVVGRSLSGAEPALCARAMAAAGEPWAQEIAAGALASVSQEERAAALAMASAARATIRTTPERLLAIGLAALTVELEGERPGSSYRVAGRLPAPLGRALLGW